MRVQHLLDLFAAHHKRAILIGSPEAGVVAGLDLEGRLYAVARGEVLNRVNEAAVAGLSGPAGYLNPGGDGLWPAPEGTRLGYTYATGAWRVSPALTGARYLVASTTATSAELAADLDLINAQGLGIPVRAGRAVSVRPIRGGIEIVCEESFTYLGVRTLTRQECLLAAWTLSQFDCGPGCETVFPDSGPGCVWDLYAPSDAHRRLEDGLWRVRTAGDARFQLGLAASVPWIEFRRPDGLRVRRSATVPPGQPFIDIADRPPQEGPDPRGSRYSIYNDGGNGFMEIEAAGGMPEVLAPGARLAVTVTTRFTGGAAVG